MKIRWIGILVMVVWTLSASAAPQAAHVVLISIDGLRPDAIEQSKAAFLGELIREGSYCPQAKTVRPSLTLPAHTSMLTGLDVERHGVKWNDYKPGAIELPTLLSLVKGTGRGSIGFFSKPKFYCLAPESGMDFRYITPVPENWDSPISKLVRAGVHKAYDSPPDTTAPGIAGVFAAEWPKRKPAFAFVHFRETDRAGHKHKWMSDEYLEAVRVCDGAVGSILKTIRDAGLGPKTIVIVTTDHGGDGRRHDLDVPENNIIPWICAGPGVPKGLKIDRELSVTDTTPTVLQMLGVPVAQKLDGKVVGEVMAK